MRPSGPLASCAAHASNGHYGPPRFRVRGTIRWLSARMRRGLRRSYAQLYCWLCEKCYHMVGRSDALDFSIPGCDFWTAWGDAVARRTETSPSPDVEVFLLVMMMIIIIVMIVTTVVGLSLSVKQVPAASYHWSFHFHLLVVFSTFLPWSFFTLFSLFILSAFVHWFFFSIFFIGLLSNFLCWSFFPIFFIGLLSNFFCWSFSTFLH